MKNVLTNLTAIMLVVWYSLSVIGFDVHTCSSSGRTYIATVASGFLCEDIHPETHSEAGQRADAKSHSCAGCRCCQKHIPVESTGTGGGQLDMKPCCTDDFQVILLTGIRCAQESDADYGLGMETPFICRNAALDYSGSNINLSDLRTFHKPRPGDIVPRDVMVSYNIWRI